MPGVNGVHEALGGLQKGWLPCTHLSPSAVQSVGETVDQKLHVPTEPSTDAASRSLAIPSVLSGARTTQSYQLLDVLTEDGERMPLAQGMAAALPHVDRFLPGHNVASLQDLLEVLAA